jgi:hypothetical protein
MDELWGGSGPPGPPLIYATGFDNHLQGYRIVDGIK